MIRGKSFPFMMVISVIAIAAGSTSRSQAQMVYVQPGAVAPCNVWYPPPVPGLRSFVPPVAPFPYIYWYGLPPVYVHPPQYYYVPPTPWYVPPPPYRYGYRPYPYVRPYRPRRPPSEQREKPPQQDDGKTQRQGYIMPLDRGRSQATGRAGPTD